MAKLRWEVKDTYLDWELTEEQAVMFKGLSPDDIQGDYWIDNIREKVERYIELEGPIFIDD